MGYTAAAGCYKMFTQGQIARMVGFLQYNVSRRPLWQDDNLDATGTDVMSGASLSANTWRMEEKHTNDGSILDSSILTLLSATLADLPDTVTEGCITKHPPRRAYGS